MKRLYKFYWDCGRMGDVEGLFIADEKEVDKSIGKFVYFGEILGKHSEVDGHLDKEDLEMVDYPEDVLKLLEKTVADESGTIRGYNPLLYLVEDE